MRMIPVSPVAVPVSPARPPASPLASPIDAVDPRARVLVSLGFALLVVSLHDLGALAAALAVALGFAGIAALSPRTVLGRMLALEGAVLATIALLPFTTPGTPWLTVGGLPLTREGCVLALAILLKANAITLVLLALLGTAEPPVLGQALARLGVPDKLILLHLFTVRYLAVIQDEYRRLRLAMRARGFAPRCDRHTWRTFGWLIGMLIVRSLERSERIVAAMRCRGFEGHFRPLVDDTDTAFRRHDGLFGAASLASLGGLALIEVLGRGGL